MYFMKPSYSVTGTKGKCIATFSVTGTVFLLTSFFGGGWVGGGVESSHDIVIPDVKTQVQISSNGSPSLNSYSPEQARM